MKTQTKEELELEILLLNKKKLELEINQLSSAKKERETEINEWLKEEIITYFQCNNVGGPDALIKAFERDASGTRDRAANRARYSRLCFLLEDPFQRKEADALYEKLFEQELKDFDEYIEKKNVQDYIKYNRELNSKFLLKHAEMIYSYFSKSRIEKGTEAVEIKYFNENKIPYADSIRLFQLLEDEQNLKEYLDFFRSKGWSVEIEKEGSELEHDLRFRLDFYEIEESEISG